MRSICCARNAARRFQPSCTKWPTRMRRSYARIAGRTATVILRRLPSLCRGRDPSEEFLSELVSNRGTVVISFVRGQVLHGYDTRAQAISGAASFLEARASNTHENE